MGVDVVIMIELKEPYTDAQLLASSVLLCKRFGADRFWIDKKESQHALSFTNKTRCSINLNTFERYYGEGYERGNWAHCSMVLRWLNFHFTNANVYYGSDSSDILNLVTDQFLQSMDTYFFTYGAEPYRSFTICKENIPNCAFCNVELHNVGGGGGVIFYNCDGCNTNYMYSEKVQLVEVEKFF